MRRRRAPWPERRATPARESKRDMNIAGMVAAPLDNDVRALLAHEANHVILQNGLGRAGTQFMNEGLASAIVSERFGPIGRTAVHQWVRTNRSALPPLTARRARQGVARRDLAAGVKRRVRPPCRSSFSGPISPVAESTVTKSTKSESFNCDHTPHGPDSSGAPDGGIRRRRPDAAVVGGCDRARPSRASRCRGGVGRRTRR